jgi:hypothetical protein
MLKLELVMDESGGNRPQNTETSAAFSVAGLLYPSDLREDIWQKAKKLGDEIGTAKYKYREVIESDVGREKFLHLLHTETQLRIYVFYSGANAMAHEIDRSLAAQRSYESDKVDFSYTATKAATDETEPLFDQFIGYMVPQLGRYADHHDLEINLFWDDRTDISFIGDRVNYYIDKLRIFPGLTDIHRRLIFKGSTTGKLHKISQLSDVLAGDIRSYFEINGERVWSRLDPSGLYGAFNPWRIIAGSPQVATVDEPLSVGNHVKACLLPQYYKSILADSAKRHLIPFVDPRGRAGFVAVERGNRWHVLQHPD